MRKSYFLIIVLGLMMIQCKTTKKNNAMVSYEYVDGNGNVYAISSNTIVYDPITPEESSTGTYSGGEPYTVSIELQHFQAIQQAINNGIARTEDQTSQRNKGNGTLVILPSKTTYIFIMNSISKKEIEEAIYLASKR